MSNFEVPWFTEGALHSAQVARNIIYANTGGKTGIVKDADCQVLELATPGASVRVEPGTLVVPGVGLEDESYTARLTTEQEAAITATDSTGGRSDLIVARIVNPAYETPPDGSDGNAAWPTIDPANGPFADIYVYEGVPAGTTDLASVDSAATGIVLARIDIPASTSTITQTMIVDLRPSPLAVAYATPDYVDKSTAQLLGMAKDGTTYTFDSGTFLNAEPLVTATGDGNHDLLVWISMRCYASATQEFNIELRQDGHGVTGGGAHQWRILGGDQMVVSAWYKVSASLAAGAHDYRPMVYLSGGSGVTCEINSAQMVFLGVKA